MTKEQAEIILTYAESNMNAMAAGKKLFMHEATVSYHLRKVFLNTGRNPKKFFDLCFLVGMAAQILGGNEHENKQDYR